VRAQAVDARADVFAFGAVLYEMVSGARAFQRETAADTMTAILTQDPPDLVGSRPDPLPALDRIIRPLSGKESERTVPVRARRRICAGSLVRIGGVGASRERNGAGD
jgi:serine/threonine protein kinase